MISELATDKNEYEQGDKVEVDIKLINSDDSKDVIVGLEAGSDELVKKVADGWRTWQVVSKDMIFTDATKK